MSNTIANTAGETADRWTEKNAEVLEKLFALRNETEQEIMKVQAKLYGKFYAARKAEIAKIPHFWFGAFIKHPALSVHMSPQDQEAMTYLEDLTLTQGEEGKHIESYDLTFTFKENPFFSNTEIKKSFQVEDNDEGFDVVGSAATIDWKDDEHNLVKKSPRKIDESDESAVGLDPGSFFNFFTEKEDFFSIGENIRDDLLPKAVEWFAGIGEDDEDEDDFEDESGDDEDLSFDTRPTKKVKA